ncbi:MAG: ABC transporter ATP-binding protein [Chloroflexia bacterium]
MIRLERVSYTYPDDAGRTPSCRPALDRLDLEIEEGEFLLLAGPSGSGKSTLLRCLNGLVPHFYGGTFSGKISVLGQDPVACGPGRMSRLAGLVFQNPEAQGVAPTVEEELAFAMENHGLPEALMRRRIEEVMDWLGISHLRGRRLETLSGGERQRVAVGAVLTLRPRLLLLDEPTSQLDPQGAEEVLEALERLKRTLGLTVILAEHRLERVLGRADRILYLPGDGGPPLLGRPREVLRQMPWVPPVVALGQALGWEPLPLTVDEARRFVGPERCIEPVETMGGGGRTRWAASPPASHPVIRVTGLSFAYNGRPALKGVHLEVFPGEIVALMGANGAGKTTLLKHLVGLLRPQEGQVEVCGLDTRRVPMERLVARVGYVPQNPDMLLFADTVAQEMDFTLRQHGRPAGRYGEMPALLGLQGYLGRYPRDLSVGERQRVALAAILVAEPEVILLDEPTRGLDYAQKEALERFLLGQKQAGRTIVLATHDVELAARCADRAVLLEAGEVRAEGPVWAVMARRMDLASQIQRLYPNSAWVTVEDVLNGTTGDARCAGRH